jgi:CBS domain-containing protein
MKAPKVSEIMTERPVCALPRTPLLDVARMMQDRDCGAIPIVGEDMFPIGIVTDRDIVMRAIALGKDPATLTAGDVMSTPASTITEKASLDDCAEALELAQIRRIIVVDRSGRMTGIVAQADVANHLKKKAAGELLRAISKPVPPTRAAAEAAADPAAD